MKSIVYIIIGILIIIGGIRHNESRVIPEFLYYLVGGAALLIGIYKLFVSSNEGDEK